MNIPFAFVLIFAAFIAVALSADCTRDDKTFAKGEKYHPPGKCMELTCAGKNNWHGMGCPMQYSVKNCEYIPMDKSKPYPECCARFSCEQ